MRRNIGAISGGSATFRAFSASMWRTCGAASRGASARFRAPDRELHTRTDAAKNAASFISPVAWPLQIVLLVTQILLSKDAPAPKWMKVEDRRTAVAEP